MTIKFKWDLVAGFPPLNSLFSSKIVLPDNIVSPLHGSGAGRGGR